jgi:hypothetical protein
MWPPSRPHARKLRFRDDQVADRLWAMGSLPALKRWSFMAVILVACALPAWGQSIGRHPNEDSRIWVPERRAAPCQEVWETRRHVPSLAPLFPHLGLAVLQDIKELEQRPEDIPGEWAVPLRRWYELRNHCAPPTAPLARERMSEDERALRSGDIQRRLIVLAITGRISKQEFDGLVKRLQGD